MPGEDDTAPETDTDVDTEQTEIDAAFAWFGIALPPPPQAAPAIVAFGQPVAAVTLPEGEAAPLPEAVLPDGLTDPAPVAAETLAAGEVAPAFELAASSVEAVAAPKIDGVDTPRLSRTDGPVRIELPAKIELPAGSPLLQTIAALQPRAEVAPILATLAASAGIELPEQFRRPAAREPLIGQLTPTSATEMLRPNVVQAVADAQQAAIDTRRGEWMTQTIERIEALRDSPNSRETSIRLSPDALGTVDVSIRHEGDRIHVRFTAENAQARTLLTEAQSRLTEIAESRGLKLGQTSVDAGTAGQGQRQDAAPAKTMIATAPASAPGGETETNADARVA
ncbi:MAG: flagellar hook-length control protein FliK [Sphingomonas sp.]